MVFVIEESFAGSLEAQGFEERLMRLGPPPEVEEEPGQFWKDFIRDTAPVFRKSTFEQLDEFMAPTWEGCWRELLIFGGSSSRRCPSVCQHFFAEPRG